MSTSDIIKKNEVDTLKNVQKLLMNVSDEQKLDVDDLYNTYLTSNKNEKEKKYKTRIEEFGMHLLRRIPHEKYIFYYDTNGYIYQKFENNPKMKMVAYYDRNKKIVNQEGKIHSTIQKFVSKNIDN